MGPVGKTGKGNQEGVQEGVYRQYMTDKSLLYDEAKAREEGLGLWSMNAPVPPWDWRRVDRARSSSTVQVADLECESKRYCREMVSCEEARFYLESCGLSRLDGDQDGVPCETICR